MICVTAPGLPPLPRLMFDPKTRRAVVKARHATWRSHEWGLRLAKTLGLFACLFLLSSVWGKTQNYEPGVRIVSLVVAVIACRPLSLVLQRSTQRFFARRLFATRTIVWFTPQAIGFRSRLYDNGIVVWRSWNGMPVSGRFTVTGDGEASEHRASLTNRCAHDVLHLDSARILRLVLSTVSTRTTSSATLAAPVRSIPLTEVDEQIAERLTVVYSTAAALTARAQVEAIKHDATTGIDIDTL